MNNRPVGGSSSVMYTHQHDNHHTAHTQGNLFIVNCCVKRVVPYIKKVKKKVAERLTASKGETGRLCSVEIHANKTVGWPLKYIAENQLNFNELRWSFKSFTQSSVDKWYWHLILI
jgi:hypothetical protein